MNKRYDYVDLLRGFAALAVLVCHYRWFFARQPMDWRTDIDLPLYSILWPVYDHGGIAVQVFWVLSGFVFAVAYGRGVDARTFWVHRIARLYPLHLATLLIIAGLQWYSVTSTGGPQIYDNNTPETFLLHLLFASNWFTMETSFNGPIWSVSIEVLIYFMFLIYIQRIGLSLWAALGILAASFASFLLTHSYVAMCAALFFAGLSLAILTPSIQRRAGKMTLALGAGGVIASLALCYLMRSDTPFIWLGTVSALFLFVAFDENLRPLPTGFHWIGAITYAVYLLHMPVLIALRLTFGIVPLWAFVGLVVGLSIPVYYWFELPAQRWIKRLGRHRLDNREVQHQRLA
jgi:peptidoglycan/LPS O-acetylase OafA/YrhL